MELLAKQITQAKDMFLKNEKYLLFILVIVFYFFAPKAYSASEDKAEALNYLSSLSDFSASFIQSDGNNLSEGRVYICLLYTSPSPRDMRRSRMPSSA